MLTGNTFGTFLTYLSVDPSHQTPPAFHQGSKLNLHVPVRVQVQFQGVVQENLNLQVQVQEFPLEQLQDLPQLASQLLQSAP